MITCTTQFGKYSPIVLTCFCFGSCMAALYDFGYSGMPAGSGSLITAFIFSLELVVFSSVHGMIIFPLCSVTLGGLTAYEAEKILGLLAERNADALYMVLILILVLPVQFLVADRGMAQSEKLILSLKKAGRYTKESVLCSFAIMFTGIAAYALLTVHILKI